MRRGLLGRVADRQHPIATESTEGGAREPAETPASMHPSTYPSVETPRKTTSAGGARQSAAAGSDRSWIAHQNKLPASRGLWRATLAQIPQVTQGSPQPDLSNPLLHRCRQAQSPARIEY